jgi:hypothetical protein
VRKHGGKKEFVRPKSRWNDIKIILKEIGWKGG